MFRPNQLAGLKRATGFDLHARETFAAARTIPVAIVRLASKTQKTTVRADSSASRGSAEEVTVDGIVLVKPDLEIGQDDRILFAAFGVRAQPIDYRVVGIHPRYTVNGKLDHQEIHLEIVP